MARVQNFATIFWPGILSSRECYDILLAVSLTLGAEVQKYYEHKQQFNSIMLPCCLMSHFILFSNARTQYMKVRNTDQNHLSNICKHFFWASLPSIRQVIQKRVSEEKVNLLSKVKFHILSPRTE